MKKLTLGFVAQATLGVELGVEAASQPVARAVVDSREVVPGSLFFALRGERTDGHYYLQDAASRGAIAAIVSSDWAGQAGLGSCISRMGNMFLLAVPDPLSALQQLAALWRREMPAQVVGVTGSVGKTLTRDVIAATLGQDFTVLRSERNYNNEIGLPLSLLGLHSGHAYAVLEMGMYALGEIAQLAEISQPNMGVVTNVGPTHLERLGSIERIAEAKAELIRALPADGAAILNGDDPRVRAMASLTRAEAITFGFEPGSSVQAVAVQPQGLRGLLMRVRAEGQERELWAPLLGRHSAYACLAAIAVARRAGMRWDSIAAGLRRTGPCNRMRVVNCAGVTILDDSYNAAPASVLAALEVLASTDGRHVAVLGDMLELGSYTEIGHQEVGAKAVGAVDVLITVGQRAAIVATAAIAKSRGEMRVFACASREEAIALMPTIIKEGDVVLVKGSRAMQMELIVDALLRLLGEHKG